MLFAFAWLVHASMIGYPSGSVPVYSVGIAVVAVPDVPRDESAIVLRLEDFELELLTAWDGSGGVLINGFWKLETWWRRGEITTANPAHGVWRVDPDPAAEKARLAYEQALRSIGI
jgi:hypothetical protein